MAATTAPFQIPQHITALLSHLTSRPGVQSTFILSRKDGSIIQSTGLIASKPLPTNTPTTQTPAPTEESRPESAPLVSPTSPTTPTADPSSPSTSTSGPTSGPPPTSPPTSQQQQQQHQQNQQQQSSTTPYQPSHAEALAAHVFAFVASATDLSLSLSRPPGSSETGESSVNGTQEGGINGSGNGTGTGSGSGSGGSSGGREDGEGGGEGFERDEDDEVKLLRMRTKKHEIVVVPDRKYLLCVVHDAAGAGAGSSGSGGGGAMGGVGGRGR